MSRQGELSADVIDAGTRIRETLGVVVLVDKPTRGFARKLERKSGENRELVKLAILAEVLLGSD